MRVLSIITFLSTSLLHFVLPDGRFPVEWTGDQFIDEPCTVQGNIPSYIDGYFLSQLSASFGDQSHMPGHKLTHLIDAIGALGTFHIHNGQVQFTGAYYPSQPFRIWEYYGRDLNRSQIVWNSWSDYNRTAADQWQSMRLPDGVVPWHPNRAFWMLGNTVIAVGHSPLWIGLTVGLPSHEFNDVLLVKDEIALLYAEGSLHPLLMSVNSVQDQNGLLWATCSAVDLNKRKSYLIIFTIDGRGNRVIKGLQDLGTWQQDLCADDHSYHGSKQGLASYVHSILASDQFLLVPLSSLAVNPCKLKQPPSMEVLPGIDKGGIWGLDFYDDLPVRFLVFDMEMNEFLTDSPLQSEAPAFLTSFINAHQRRLGLFAVDVIAYDTAAEYFQQMQVDQLRGTRSFGGTATRFELQLLLNRRTRAVSKKTLFGRNFGKVEFAELNSARIGKSYEYAYLIQRGLHGDSVLIKASSTDQSHLEYTGGPEMSFIGNPEFVPSPSNQTEDDGVLLVRALDMSTDKGVLLIVNATDMTPIARVTAPVSVPLGMTNMYVSRAQLGLAPAPVPKSTTSRQTRRTTRAPLPTSTWPSYTFSAPAPSTTRRQLSFTQGTSLSPWVTTTDYSYWRTSSRYGTLNTNAGNQPQALSKSALCSWFPRLFDGVDTMC